MELKIRREEPKDYETVERITREAFYNMYIPGCVEHYLVHIMRGHEDFIPELDFVLELNGEVAPSAWPRHTRGGDMERSSWSIPFRRL